jgi:hypothetical protein
MKNIIHIYSIVSRSVLLRMRIVSDKSCGEKESIDFMLSNFYFENQAMCETMWKNIVESDRPPMIIGRMPVACWITKTTDTLKNM